MKSLSARNQICGLMGFFRFHLFTDFIPPHPPFLFSGFCWRHVAPRKSEKTSYASVNFAVQDVFFVELVFPYLLLWGPGPPLRSNEGQTMAFRSKSPSRVEKLAAYQWKLRRRHQCSQCTRENSAIRENKQQQKPHEPKTISHCKV